MTPSPRDSTSNDRDSDSSAVDPARAEAALREREERYRTLFNTIDEGFCIMEVIRNDEGHVVDLIYREVNPAYSRLAGHHVEPGQRVRDLLPNIEDRWFERYDRVLLSGAPEHLEDTTADTGRWYRLTYSRVGDPEGSLVCCVFSDITDRKRTEIMLQEREERHAFLLQLSDEFRANPGEDAVGLTCVQALAAHMGVERCYITELSSELNRGLVGPEYHAAGLAPISGVQSYSNYPNAVRDLKNGAPFVTSDIGHHPDLSETDKASIGGGLGLQAMISAPLYQGRGNSIWALTVGSARARVWTDDELRLVQDVAERTWAAIERARAEAALRDSEERFRTVLDGIGESFYALDADWRFLFASRAALKQWGKSADEVLGQNFLEAFPQAAGSDAYEAHRRVMRTREPERLETISPVLRRWIEVDLAPTPQGGLSVAFRDIQARKEAEQWQRMELDEVERLVAARTSERDELRRQLAAAEEEERRRLARELHDQLGQELTAFRLGLDDALRVAEARSRRGSEGSDASLRERLLQLQTLALRLTASARHIALDLRPPELDDVGLVGALETYVREWSARYGISGEVAASGVAGELAVSLDTANALYRIAQEALTNVAKHANASQVSVLVSASDGAIQLIVEDNGDGFEVDVAKARAKAERRLGLAGMMERAALVGGTVNVESSPGTGTTLFIRIPVA